MNVEQIKTAPVLKLKPNGVFVDPEIPYLYQRRAGLIMLTRPRMILGDDVGLGKTLELLLMVSYVKAANPGYKILVMTERVSYRQWLKEAAWLVPALGAKIITADTHPKAADRVKALAQFDQDVLITGYWTLYDYSAPLIQGMGDKWILICDEPNFFKNEDSLMHQQAYGAFVGDFNGNPFRLIRERDDEGKMQSRMEPIANAKPPTRSYGATATVVENRLEEAFGIFRVIAPGTFGSRQQFEKDYCIMKKIKRGLRVVTGYKNLDKFRKQIEPFFFGRLQEDPEVMQDLPEVITKDIELTMSLAQSKKVVEAMDKLLELPDGEVQQLTTLSSLTRCQQLVNDPRLLGFDIDGVKTEALIEMLTNSLYKQRVLIYSKYRTMIDRLELAIKAAGLESVRITGKMSTAERERSQDRFMSDGEDHCPILLTTKAGSKALNLQKGGHLFFYDMPWSYGIYRQIIGRLKRTGSVFKKIGVYRLLAVLHPGVLHGLKDDHTIDHYSVEIIKKKFKLHQAITGDIETVESVTSDIGDILKAIKEGFKRDEEPA